jgi:exosortase/archaeosortase family protein
MMHPAIASALVLVATWDSWHWYLGRVAMAPDDILALIVVVAILAITGPRCIPPPTAAKQLPLATLALLLTGYAASRSVVPPIARAGLAAALSLFCLHVTVFRRRPPAALWGMAALALPILPSLQFMLGYPLRISSAALTALLLKTHGLAIERQGTFLVWKGAFVQFDALCSGVNMLWADLLLTLGACALLQLGAMKTTAAVACSVVLAVAANVLRTSSLYYLETGFTAGVPGWLHEATGLAAFALSAAVMGWLLNRLRA